MVITRFAPSPTGTLHIGSVRTILFNWLYAKRYGGKFLLRIEDTDKERSKLEFVENIFQTLKNLNLNYDDEVVFQSSRYDRHRQAALQLLNEKKAYKCYCTQEELENERLLAQKENRTPQYSRKCRNLEINLEKPFTVRLKTDLTGEVEFKDLIQGNCKVKNEHMDDMILLRSDQTPTYMFAVVVDDHDMNITHIIRGTEHLNNAYRQIQIYKAFNWEIPNFAHVSLIHAEDGSKLSKRTGAKSVEEYQNEGFLKEAILNYLLRLGWTYGIDEIISIEKCCEIFDIKDVRSSAARFSLSKLLNINSIYLRAKTNKELVKMLKDFEPNNDFSESGWLRIENGMNELKERSRTLKELFEMSKIYGYDENFFGEIEKNSFLDKIANQALNNPWEKNESKEWLTDLLNENKIELKEIAPILRFVLTKEKVAPSIFDMMEVLGPQIFAKRIQFGNIK